MAYEGYTKEQLDSEIATIEGKIAHLKTMNLAYMTMNGYEGIVLYNNTQIFQLQRQLDDLLSCRNKRAK